MLAAILGGYSPVCMTSFGSSSVQTSPAISRRSDEAPKDVELDWFRAVSLCDPAAVVTEAEDLRAAANCAQEPLVRQPTELADALQRRGSPPKTAIAAKTQPPTWFGRVCPANLTGDGDRRVSSSRSGLGRIHG